MENILSPFFSRFIEFDKPQGTFCNGPTGFLTGTVEITRSFLKHLRLTNIQIFENKAIFPVKKILWPISLVLSSVTNLKGQVLRVQKVL